MKSLKRVIVVIFFLHQFLSLKGQETKNTFELEGHSIELIYDTSMGFTPQINVDKKEEGLEIATIVLESEHKFTPENLSLQWAVPSTNIAGYWSSHAFLDKTITPNWGPAKVTSMLSREAPVICLFGHNDMNRQTFAVSDVLNTVVSSTAVKEEDGMIYNKIKLFTEKHKEVFKYTVQLRLDTRAINYGRALTDVASWWTSFELYKPAQVPEAAKMPVYSTWYSYHQNVTKESILNECKQAKDMGYQTVIVDDGWQTLDSNRGYAYTGDWQPERIPEMKELVKAVHDMDMKFILWYAVPFVGEKSTVYEKMKGKFLDYWESQGTYVLDPRYPEVRTFIIDTYIKAVKEWNLDGFKLDFIGRFRANKNTKLTAEEGRDYASVNLATDKLMTDLMKTLIEIKPDIMVEFRQPYTGPAMRKYGNMLRASDCPNVAMVNRVETSDLRLLSGNTAVHADMLMWNYDESVEVAALQFLNVLYSVPQISVRLGDIPKDHFEMIRFYTEYWLKNRDVLLEGKFYPHSPQMNYPMIEGENDRKKIITVFDDRIVPLETTSGNKQDVINAKSTGKIIIEVTGSKRKYKYNIYDCIGNIVLNKDIELDEGILSFHVPPSGLISFTPTE